VGDATAAARGAGAAPLGDGDAVAARRGAGAAAGALGPPAVAAMAALPPPMTATAGSASHHLVERFSFMCCASCSGRRACRRDKYLPAAGSVARGRKVPIGGQVAAGSRSGFNGRRSAVGVDRRPETVSPEEFTDFYAASFRRLVGQLFAMTGDAAEAQDAVQEAFVRAWAHRRKLDASGSPEAWVRSAAWRIAVSRWHRARAGGRLLRAQPPPPPAAGPSPDRVALIDALRKVPAEQRRAIVLYHLCDLTVAQIAAETGVPEGTVKARLARGRAALAPFLSDAEDQTAGREVTRA
jgi:RNA polymerase sigma-70 factor (ECF subfamily)